MNSRPVVLKILLSAILVLKGLTHRKHVECSSGEMEIMNHIVQLVRLLML